MDDNVKECIHYNEVDDDREYCQLTYNIIKKKCQKKCKDVDNCYFKQNLALKEELEKLNYIVDKQDRALNNEMQACLALKQKLKSILEPLGISDEHSAESLNHIISDYKRSDKEFSELIYDNAFISQKLDIANQKLKLAVEAIKDIATSQCYTIMDDGLYQTRNDLMQVLTKIGEVE